MSSCYRQRTTENLLIPFEFGFEVRDLAVLMAKSFAWQSPWVKCLISGRKRVGVGGHGTDTEGNEDSWERRLDAVHHPESLFTEAEEHYQVLWTHVTRILWIYKVQRVHWKTSHSASRAKTSRPSFLGWMPTASSLFLNTSWWKCQLSWLLRKSH